MKRKMNNDRTERLHKEADFMLQMIKYIHKRDLLPADWLSKKKDMADLIDRIESEPKNHNENYDGRMKEG